MKFLVMPYVPYSRQDKVDDGRTPYLSKLIMRMIQDSGASKLLTVNIHSHDICGFNDLKIVSFDATACLFQRFFQVQEKSDSYVVVSPDIGNLSRCQRVMKDYKMDGTFFYKGNLAEIFYVNCFREITFGINSKSIAAG